MPVPPGKDLRPQLEAYLDQGLRELGLDLNPEVRTRLLLYLEDLATLAPALGLSNLKDPQEVVVKHVLDSLLALPYLPPEGPLLDLGTGAGLPGVVIKIVQPTREVWLVDARKKAASFLHYVAGKLNLSSLRVLQATVGQDDPLPRGYFAAVVSRAVTALEKLWELAHSLLREGGLLVALKGPRVGQEIERLKAAYPELVVSWQDRHLPLLGNRRVLVKCALKTTFRLLRSGA